MKKVFFCYLDVLGFKEKLKEKSDDEQVAILQALFGCISFSIPESFLKQTEPNKSLINLEAINTNFILISDSLLVWTNANDFKNISEFLYRIQRLVRNTLVAGFPLRGTIEYGSIFHQETKIPTIGSYNHFDLIGGSALMGAYKEEQNYNWMGCTLSKNCVAELKNIVQDKTELEEIFKPNILIEYEAPKKTNEFEKLFTINWVDSMLVNFYQKNEIINLFMKYINPVNIHAGQTKLDNTNQYLKYVAEKGWANQFIGVRQF